ncbi:MAG: hypothetical protein Q8L36_02400 [bacterium]|nr:hypothetical protein [bacterium]
MAETTLPSQQFVAIQEIRDGIIYLKSGGLRRVLMVNGINFDLKSDTEQNIILSSFQNFLNGLDFPIQFFIHSRKINIEEYTEKILERKKDETNELLKIQIDDYVSFIRSFVTDNDIIDKNFFVVVPYETSVATMAAKKGLFDFLPFGKSTISQTQKAEMNSQKDLQQLNERVDQIVKGLNTIGLRAIPLEDEPLIELFYNLYNPQIVEKKDLAIAKKQQ